MMLTAGLVTLLFTDIEGGVQLWEADRDAMAAASARNPAHDRRLVQPGWRPAARHHRRQGWAEMWLTTAFDDDQENAGDVRRAANLRWISQGPVMGQIPQPLRLDYSPLDGRSVLIDERTRDACQAIEEILLPPGLRVGALDAGDNQLMARWRKRIRDVQHLASHFFQGHDVFVTSDEDDMIDKRDELRRRTGIVIDTPAEAVLRVRNSRGQARQRARPWPATD